MFFDVHTHLLKRNSIINVDNDKIEFQHGYFYSIGIHPWRINTQNIQQELLKLELLLQKKEFIAIGECGIDRSIDTPVELQKDIFNKHLQLAQRFKKPIIIHCVRAYSDIIELLVKSDFSGTLIFHDYRGNQHQTQKLNEFQSYYSFGKSLLSPSEKILISVKTIDKSKVLLETDDSDISIEKIYICAAKILKISVDELELIILKNIGDIYGDRVAGKN